MKNLSKFLTFMQERESIRLRRAEGLEPPWTDDKILAKYRFTNVHRWWDNMTTVLRENYYRQHENSPWPEIIVNAATFRWTGIPSTARALGWRTKHEHKKFVKAMENLKEERGKIFTGAYVITNGGEPCSKIEYVARVLDDVQKAAPELAKIAKATNSWKDFGEWLSQLRGFGGTGFMAKELMLDLMMTPVLRGAKDRGTWTPVGPGARKGLNWLSGREREEPVSDEKALREVLEAYDELVSDWWAWAKTKNVHLRPAVAVRALEPHDVQFALCEFDKYSRTKKALGRGERVTLDMYELGDER